MTKILVDTNILIYSVLESDEKKHRIANDIVKDLVRSEEFVLSSQNLAEFCRVLLEKNKPRVESFELRNLVLGFLRFSSFISYSEMTVLEALSSCDEYKVNFFDALLIASMKENGIVNIMTENVSDFSRVPWLKVINPFEN